MSRRGPVVVVDIDSTLADTRHRRHLAPQGEDRHTMAGWLPYAMACAADEVISGTAELLRLLYAGGHYVFILSARNRESLDLTGDWLWKHDIPHHLLRLRGTDEEDGTPSDWKVKVIQGWQQEGWEISLFIDDWAETCQAVTTATGIPSIAPAFLAGDYKPGH